MKKNKSITSTLIESTSLKAENKHIYFRIPRQVDYDVELVWGIPKRKNSARVAPNDKNKSFFCSIFRVEPKISHWKAIGRLLETTKNSNTTYEHLCTP